MYQLYITWHSLRIPGTTGVVRSVQVWDAACTTCIHTRQLATDHADPAEGTYWQGSCAVTCEDDACVLCIGGSDGRVRVFKATEEPLFQQVPPPQSKPDLEL
jgi:hypothetical protein